MIRIKDYFELWKAGRINVKPNIKVVHESPSTAVVDGDNSVGMVCARKSMELAIEKAGKSRYRMGGNTPLESFRDCRILCNDGAET